MALPCIRTPLCAPASLPRHGSEERRGSRGRTKSWGKEVSGMRSRLNVAGKDEFRRRAERAALLTNVRGVFVTEILQRADDRRDRRITKGANGAPGNIGTEPGQGIEIFGLAYAMLESLKDLQQPGSSLP